MQSMQPMGQEPNQAMAAYGKLATVVSFISTVFIAPTIYAEYKNDITSLVVENYGAYWYDISVFAWGVVCALLVFNLINFILQSVIMVGVIALFRRFF